MCAHGLGLSNTTTKVYDRSGGRTLCRSDFLKGLLLVGSCSDAAVGAIEDVSRSSSSRSLLLRWIKKTIQPRHRALQRARGWARPAAAERFRREGAAVHQPPPHLQLVEVTI